MSSPFAMSSAHSQARETHTEKERVQDHDGKILVNDDDNIVEIYTTWHCWVTRLDCTTDLKG